MVSQSKSEMKPTYPTPIDQPDNDLLFYRIVCLLDKLNLTEYGDIHSIYKWLKGEE